MRITHLGHACVLVEIATAAGSTARILLDPGNFSTGLAEAGRVDATLITHEHVDHVDPVQVDVVRTTSPSAPMYGGAGTAAVLRSCGVDPIELTDSGQYDIAGVRVDVIRGVHEHVHPAIPVPDNHAYLIGGSVLHPGDAWTEVAAPVDVLLLPIGGPWLKLEESVDYLRRVRPRVAVPIHQQGLVREHQQLHLGVVTRLAPEGTEVVALDLGRPTSV